MGDDSAVVEPHLTLAFAMRSTPGGYALMLGAGISIGSGVPSAWEVQDRLIRRLAAMRGDDPDPDAFAWYTRVYGRKATYDGLLAELTTSQAERQALLRGFFEPDEQEREEGLKRPTPAHRAVARLVAAGLVRVILTTNFDFLMEDALREEGVEPTIVSNPAAIAGLSPTHTIGCLVVHLHGHYLDPTGMLNTADELNAYPAELDGLLDKTLPDYGLVIAGWSATWDTALRNALSRNPNRFFATYWVDPFPLSDAGRQLSALRRAVYVKATADDFLGRVADATDALARTQQRHPLSVPVAVATAKRALSGARVAISLHDTLREELERLHRHPVLLARNFNVGDVAAVYADREAQLRAALEVPAALVATTAYWGDPSTDDWWLRDIVRLSGRFRAGGMTALIDQVHLPATVLFFAAGISATAAGRDDLVARLLTYPFTDDEQGRPVVLEQEIAPERTLVERRAHRWLHLYLQPVIEGHLGVGAAAYLDASERFEYLRLAQATYRRLRAQHLHEQGPQTESSIRTLKTRVQNAHTNPSMGADEVAGEERALADARSRELDERAQRARHAHVDLPHFRVAEHGERYRSHPSEQLTPQIELQFTEHPLIRGGLGGGNAPQFRWAMIALDDRLGKVAHDAALSTITGGGGIVPSELVLDEVGRWADTPNP